MKKFYGLTGLKLNIAIAVIAGTDFALFGYGESSSILLLQKLISKRSGCYGRPVDAAFFPSSLYVKPSILDAVRTEAYETISPVPEIDTVHPPAGQSSSYVSTIQGITVGSYTLGCFFGAVATIWLGNILGRKRTIFTGSLIMVIGATLQASSFSLPQLIVGRWITGFGNGMSTSTLVNSHYCLSMRLTNSSVPTWQAETSKSHRRGQMVMIEVRLKNDPNKVD